MSIMVVLSIAASSKSTDPYLAKDARPPPDVLEKGAPAMRSYGILNVGVSNSTGSVGRGAGAAGDRARPPPAGDVGRFARRGRAA
jgi:hypothetical protein